jgi:TolB-like protein
MNPTISTTATQNSKRLRRTSSKKIAVKPFEKFDYENMFDQLDQEMFSETCTVTE